MFKTNTLNSEVSEVNFSIEPVKATQPPQLPKFKLSKPKDDADKAINAFLTGQVGKFGDYVSVPNALVYRKMITDRRGETSVAQNVVALRINRPTGPLFIGNSSALPLIGRRVSFGRETLNRSATDIQTRLSMHIQMVPFSVFAEAGLDLTSIEILERGPEEQVFRTDVKTVYKGNKSKEIKTHTEVHFTGASLFQVDSKCFLFDIDRRETKHKIFNPFLVQLSKPAKTIAEAYQNLKPVAVVKAEKQGLEVLRQGEWFFIPVTGDYEPTKAREGRWDKKHFEPLTLQAGNNRPNTVSKYANVDGKKYVTGIVEHTGREHAALTLNGWFEAVPNTSVNSFTITGDID